MSFLRPARNVTHELTTLTPSAAHITVAGTNGPKAAATRMASKVTYAPSSVRAHLAAQELKEVVSYTEIVPLPTGLTGHVTTEQMEAAQELAQYASDLCAPILCAHTGDHTFESTTAFRGDTSIETLAQNLREFNLCMKTTVSSDNPHFTPSVFRIDADDLDHLCKNQVGLEHEGSVSKFIQSVTDGVPHHILFHAIQNGGKHAFYGISYVEKAAF